MRSLAITLIVVYLLTLVCVTLARAKLTPQQIRFWTAVARCETGGNWRMTGPTYEGGVGFYVGTWRWWASELGLLRRYPHANQAPARVQMRVAQYGYTAHDGYWGCIR